MKTLYLIVLVFCLFACSKTAEKESVAVEEEISYADFTISLDTVLVNSNDEIVMASVYSPYGHEVSPDLSKHLYWNVRAFSLEIIDIDSLKFVKKQSFNREGPDEVGFSLDVEMIDQEHIAFHNWDQSVISDLEGNVVERISKQEEWMKEMLKPSENFYVRYTSPDRKILFCSISEITRLNSNILKIDLKNKVTEIIELPEFDKRENFRIAYSTGGGGGLFFPKLLISKYNENLIFWSDAFNAIYQYDPKSDSLTYHEIISTLTANEKSGKYKNDVASDRELTEEMNKIKEEITFSELFWDSEKEIFYRFSYYELPKVEDEPIKYKHFLSVIDEDFNLIGEKEITSMISIPLNTLFIKDSMIYSHLNVDDELAYIRMKIN